MKKILSMLLVLAIILSLAGCASDYAASAAAPTAAPPVPIEKQLQNESKAAAVNQQSLAQKLPAPKMDWSNERANLIKRAETFGSDPNKVAYVTLLTANGAPIATYVIKGKVSSLNSYLVPDENIVKDPYFFEEGFDGRAASMAGIVVQQPDIDGSYGSNPQGIFFYTTDGGYVEWNGLYVCTDKPYKLNAPTLFVGDGENR